MKLEEQILESVKVLKPVHVDLVNESDKHSGPPNRETHFKLTLVSPTFEGLSRIQRQQSVYQILGFAFKAGLHALSLRTLSPEDWKKEVENFESPDCAHQRKL